MEFLYKPDYEMTLRRFEAFWNREIVDRPPVTLAFRKPDAAPVPKRNYATYEEMWLDIDARTEDMDAEMAGTDFLYDSLPIACPSIGPEIFSAWCGCGYKYGATTTWSEPVIKDWVADFDKGRLDMNHPLFKKVVEFTRKLIDAGRGKFIVGLPDLHPGGDHVAALRDPQNLAMDLIDEPEYVKKALERSMPEYYAIYGVLYNMIREAGMPATSWMPIIHEGTFYIPSNDFSCMISTKMFEEFFLPGIAQECRFYDRSIYHLDGPGALRHLDRLLEIPELDAVQWVPGAGNEGFSRWIGVYRQIQRAKKGVYIECRVDDLPSVFENLRPEGVWFARIDGIKDREMAGRVVKSIERWRI